MTAIPNPPVKRLKQKNTSKWFCTDDGVPIQSGAQIYSWSGNGLCFDIPPTGEYHMEDDSYIVLGEGGIVVSWSGESDS